MFRPRISLSSVAKPPKPIAVVTSSFTEFNTAHSWKACTRQSAASFHSASIWLQRTQITDEERRTAAPERKEEKVEFHGGDLVEYNVGGRTTQGYIVQKITSETEVGSRRFRASPDHPEYIIRNIRTGHETAHRPDVLKLVRKASETERKEAEEEMRKREMSQKEGVPREEVREQEPTPEERADQFLPGDMVSYNTAGAPTEGLIVQKITTEMTVGGRRYRASPERPEYIVRNLHTGHLTSHRPEALHLISRSGPLSESTPHFNIGDYVEYDTGKGYTRDFVVRILTSPEKVGGRHHRATPDVPEYVVRNESTGHEVARRADALRLVMSAEELASLNLNTIPPPEEGPKPVFPFEVGDYVKWRVGANISRGVIVKKFEKETMFDGIHYRATPEHPEFVVRNLASGHETVHKPEHLIFVGRAPERVVDPPPQNVEFKPGDRVEWGTAGSVTRGVVVRKITEPMQIGGRHYHPSPDFPEYVCRNESTGHESAHRPSALTLIKRAQ